MTPSNLLDRKGFCVLPFIHSCIFQNGNAQPCCMNYLPLGNTKEQTLEEIYSTKNKKLIDFRKDFLGDSLPQSCFKCTDMENKYNGKSYRNISNNAFGHLLNRIDISSEEVLINNEKLLLWDIRFSNLCNLKCIICRPEDSSRIAEEEEEGKLVSAFNNIDEFIHAFEKQIDNIVEINFAGGEPLLIKEHYKILELLIKYEKFNVILRYNTNGTTISLGNKEVIEYWKYFKKVNINFSLDAGWEQFEYIRYGSNWEIVLQNLRRIRYFAPHVNIQICIVLIALNALYTRQLYEFLIEETILNHESHLYFIPIFGKDYYEVSVLPANLKEKALQYYQDWEDSLKDSGRTVIMQSIQTAKNMITSKDTSYNLPELKKRTLIKDKMRGTDFYKTFPELKDIFDNV